MSDRSFFSELKRRNVYKVAVAYAVVGWLVIQIGSTVLPTFHAPEWVTQTLVLLVVHYSWSDPLRIEYDRSYLSPVGPRRSLDFRHLIANLVESRTRSGRKHESKPLVLAA